MKEKRIYLTTKRLIYNVARIDHRNGHMTVENFNKAKNDWLAEYNNTEIQDKLDKKYLSSKENTSI
tara:strand:- start:262 stop:459 length:198 start_codon:yes stop_codon:yes gene_type:complete